MGEDGAEGCVHGGIDRPCVVEEGTHYFLDKFLLAGLSGKDVSASFAYCALVP